MTTKNVDDCKKVLENAMVVYNVDLQNAYMLIRDTLISLGATESEIKEAYTQMRSGVNA